MHLRNTPPLPVIALVGYPTKPATVWHQTVGNAIAHAHGNLVFADGLRPDRSGNIQETSLSPNFPDQQQIEAATLARLNIEIIDLEDYTDYCIPDGQARYQVYRCGRGLGSISKMGDRYHTRIINNLAGYASTYEAATCWLARTDLETVERAAERDLSGRMLPDYM